MTRGTPGRNRLTQLREASSPSQQRFAGLAGLHVNQVCRYAAGTGQPTPSALVSLARTLHISLDALVLEEDERGPSEEMRPQFEAVSLLPDEDRRIVSVRRRQRWLA